MREQLLVEQDPTKCLIGPELVRMFYACAKLAMIQSNTYYAPRKAMNEMAWACYTGKKPQNGKNFSPMEIRPVMEISIMFLLFFK